MLRRSGLRVVIFSNDHEPAHVHVFGDGEVKINLIDPSGKPKVVWSVGMQTSDIRKAYALVFENRLMLLKHWNELR
jgi:hypothetical protein